jgi:hypothetical protein
MIAVVSQHRHLDASVNWESPELKLPKKSGRQRKEKW